MKESKDIKKVIESYPDYLVIDIHEILVAFQNNNQKEVERLVSDVYRTDYGKIILTTDAFIKRNKLEKQNEEKKMELGNKGYSIGATEFLAGLLTCGFDKELDWDALETFSKQYFAMSDEEKNRIQSETKEEAKRNTKRVLKEICKIIIYISSITSAISFVFYISNIVEHLNPLIGWIIQIISIIPLLFVQFFLYDRLFVQKK